MKPIIRIVIQARMGSYRRPGKILASLGGVTMLEHVVRRMQAVPPRLPGYVVKCLLATTALTEDDVTVATCDALGVPCLRGSADDVLARYLMAIEDMRDDDLVIRATADNPLYCPIRTADLIQYHLEQGNDYTYIRDLSHGVPEVVRVGALRMAAHTTDPYCREHVTPYLRQEPGSLKIEELPPTWHGLRPDIRMTVDTPEDVAFVDRILSSFPDPLQVSLNAAYRLGEVLLQRQAAGVVAP